MVYSPCGCRRVHDDLVLRFGLPKMLPPSHLSRGPSAARARFPQWQIIGTEFVSVGPGGVEYVLFKLGERFMGQQFVVRLNSLLVVRIILTIK